MPFMVTKPNSKHFRYKENNMNLLGKTKFDFMGNRKLALIFSITLIVVSIASLAIRGLNFGLDFTGGTAVVVNFEKTIELDQVRDVLQQNGFADAVVQNFGSAKSVQIRLQSKSDDESSEISNKLADIILPL
ncbi:MAG TPA: hypothetical protein ENJ41_07545, partial [Oceanospirillales bacterium]|nr:hypothetical protein [Oceanospirillales bacterium]